MMIVTTGLFIALMIYLVVNSVWWFSPWHFVWIIPAEIIIWIIITLLLSMVMNKVMK